MENPKKVEDYIHKIKKINFKIGVARILILFRNHGKGFFVQDIKKLRLNRKILKINKINTPRDYIDLT